MSPSKPYVGCWQKHGETSGKLLSYIKSGPIRDAVKAGPAKVAVLLAELRRENPAKPVIFIGTGTCGLGAGARKTLDAIMEFLKGQKVDADIVEVGCIGLCSMEPIVDIQLPGRTRVSFSHVTADNAAGLLKSVMVKMTIPEDMLIGQFRSESLKPWDNVKYLDEHPFLSKQKRIVLNSAGILDPHSIDEYIAWGGYSAITSALNTKTPDEICSIIEASGLRGRGGGGFPTGKKWRFALQTKASQKYLICNADEGDPGAFMDRAVCESDPHRLLEGIILAAYAIGATKAYIYIRAEYPLAITNLKLAIEQARAYGLIGQNILDSGNNLNIALKMGAGAFVCGEETALIHSIEGKRGMPRPRPPFPAVKGLFEKPTVINNVETLANLSAIIDNGAEWFAAMGTAGSKGTKVFAVSGMVNRTGLVEVPMGTTLRQVVFDICGGIPNNKRCKAVQIGGPSGGCIPVAHLDIETDYEALKKFGAIMGSGGLVVADESTCMVDFAKFFMEFIQKESCGKCIPCREGTNEMLEILRAITRPRRKEDGSDALLRFQGVMRLQKLAQIIKDTSLCGLGQTAPNPVLSTLRWFRDEYEAHVFDRMCPAGACTELTGVSCQRGCPVGTETWRYVANIARGEYEEAYRVIRRANPFPSVCARICHHPCEQTCRAGSTGGDPIAIRSLKRFVVDRVNPETATTGAVVPAEKNAPKVAVIGAGPSGLTAAHYLSSMGYKVSLYERSSKPGGMLTCAIPEYRLPRDILDREISMLLNANVKLVCNAELGRDITVDGLFKDGFKAVYIATGAHANRKLSLTGETAKGILSGIDFLKAYNLEKNELASGRVGIVGGGNSAMDAARVAMRQKNVKSVTIFYRRTREEMPAYEEEIEAGLEEGITIQELVSPVSINEEKGKMKGVRFIKNKLGEPDASGRRRGEPIDGSEFDVELDTLIVAISEQPEVSSLEGLALTEWKTLSVDQETFETGRPGVFGGGDVVSGPSTVIGAVAAGKKAANMIHRYLSGKILKTSKAPVLPTTYVEPAEIPEQEEGKTARRVAAQSRPAKSRVKNFDEVELCISEEAAVCEARRCLRCDLEFTARE